MESLPFYPCKFCTRVYFQLEIFLEGVDDVLHLAIKEPVKCVQQVILDGSNLASSTDPDQDSSNPDASSDQQLDGSNSASNSCPKLDRSTPASTP